MFSPQWFLAAAQLMILSVIAHSHGSAAATLPSPSQLQTQLDAAIRQGEAKFVIPPGTYNFSQDNLEVQGAKQMHLVGEGATLLFEQTSGVNVTNCESLNVSGLSINYTSLPQSKWGFPGITYNLLNCTNVLSQDITIYKAPFFSVTAFNGGGGHVFRRFVLPNDTTADPTTHNPRDRFPHERDGFHFSDLRRGVVVEDSVARGFGDDFFNVHNTIMLVLSREAPNTLLVINPHVLTYYKTLGRNTVYATNCVLENLRAGDQASFFAFPHCVWSSCPSGNPEDYVTPRLGSGPGTVSTSVPVTDNATLAAAAALAAEFDAKKLTVPFDASDVWRVTFTAPVPAGAVRGSLVNLDSFSTPASVIRNNTFGYTRYHTGRFKSAGGAIVNNTFSHAGDLEVAPLLYYFEGPLPVVRNVIIQGNNFLGQGPTPVHCSALCSGKCVPGSGCFQCPLCNQTTPWTANITLSGNNIVPDN